MGCGKKARSLAVGICALLAKSIMVVWFSVDDPCLSQPGRRWMTHQLIPIPVVTGGYRMRVSSLDLSPILQNNRLTCRVI